MAGRRQTQGPTRGVERYAQFGRMLRMFREQVGMNQEELAQRAALSQAAIAQLEAGKILPTLERAADLAAILRVTVDQLLAGPAVPHVVHYHTPGEVRVWVSNGGLVVLGNYGPADIERLMDTWQHLRGRVQDQGESREPGFPTRDEALGERETGNGQAGPASS